MAESPAIVPINLRLIAANTIVGIVDLQVAAWRVTLRRCRWRNDGKREWIVFACDDISFWNYSEHRRFQQTALTAVRDLAHKMCVRRRRRDSLVSSNCTNPQIR